MRKQLRVQRQIEYVIRVDQSFAEDEEGWPAVHAMLAQFIRRKGDTGRKGKMFDPGVGVLTYRVRRRRITWRESGIARAA